MSTEHEYDIKLPDGRTGHVSKKRKFMTSSGKELTLLPVPQMVLAPLRKQLKAPKPPVQVVDGVEYPNETDPEYLEALADYEERVEEVFQAALIELGVEDFEFDHSEVDRLRERMRKPPFNMELSPSDKLVYVSMILITDAEEYARLGNAIFPMANPTPEGLEVARDTFRGEVQG